MARPPRARIAELAEKLIRSYRFDGATDERAAFQQAGAICEIFAHYPEEVLADVVHPVRGLPGRLKWFPTLAEVKAACDDLMAPLQARARADLALLETAALLAPSPPESPERREWAVADALAKMGKLSAEPEGERKRPEAPVDTLARISGMSHEEVAALLAGLPVAPARP